MSQFIFFSKFSLKNRTLTTSEKTESDTLTVFNLA